MTRFNLSEWAVNNRAIAVFFMLVCLIGGLSAYQRLGREEDPDFSIQTMVVQASWPGASVADTLTQLTDRLEKKLEETPNLDYLKSYEARPGDHLRQPEGRRRATRSRTSGTRSARRSTTSR